MLATESIEDRLARQRARLPPHLVRDGGGERRRRRDQQGLRVGAVLGLGEQIGRDEVRARAVVGDDHDLGDPGGQIDGGAGGIVRDQQFGRRHPGVARDRTACRTSVSTPCRSAMAAIACAPPTLKTRSIPALRAATSTAASAVPLRRRGGAHHAHRTAGDRGRHRQHDGGGGQRRGARGNVQTDRAHRHADALAQHSRRGLDAQRRAAPARRGTCAPSRSRCRARRAGRRSGCARRRRTPAPIRPMPRAGPRRSARV